MKKHLFGALLVFFCILLLTQCQQPRVDATASHDEGAKLFVQYCTGCHLSNGSGGQPVPGGTMEAIDIRQITKTPPQLVTIISYGFGKMPAFKDSTSSGNISLIANYVATQIEAHQGASANAPGMQNNSGK